MMFKYLVESHPTKLDNMLSEEDIDQICRLIHGGPVDPDRSWLFEIVSNSRNGIDVDKIDYLQRDSYKTNLKHITCDCSVLIRSV